jgi:hypothetical protein
VATLQDHARLILYVDQVYQQEITSLSMATNSGQQRVDLMNEGLGGFTPGSGDVTLEIGFAIPVGGQEFPYQRKCADGDFVTMQVPIGGDQYSGLGKIITCEISQSANGNTEGTCTWTGELAAAQ